ncbi:MAG: hypothetical protein NTV86_19665 [Planctomycetota bacterium]|nr:hypothetical protein [Planctomycetota bacterium]
MSTDTPNPPSASAAAAEEARLLSALEKTLAAQLAALTTGRLDLASDHLLTVQSLLSSLRSLGLTPSGRAALVRARRVHEEIVLALRQQQSEIKSDLAKLRSGKSLLRTYGQGK